MNLRPYQQEALSQTLAAYDDGAKSVLVVAATGLGKTQIFAHLAKHYVERGRIMVLAHREELVEQARARIQQIARVPVDVEMAERRADEDGLFGDKAPIVVSSIQTQSTGRMNRFDPDEFSLLILDEAHHAVSETNLRAIGYYTTNPALKVFGCTATPDRADEEALGKVFERCAYQFEILDAIREGWLVDVRRRAVTVEGLDFSAVNTVAGDFNQGQLENEMTKWGPLHGVADAAIKECGDRPTICFAVGVAHAGKLCEILNRHRDGCARFVCGETPKDERRAIFRDFLEGKYQYLTNVGVATEGVDLPLAAAIVMARPTKSRSLYCQMLGRGTRALPGVVDGPETAEARRAAIAASGKPNVIVVDFVGNVGKHELVSAVDVLGVNFDPELLRMVREQHADGEMDFLECIEEANAIREQRRLQREEAMRRANEARMLAMQHESKLRHIRGHADYSVVEIDAKDPFDVLGVNRPVSRGWHRGKEPTEKMVTFLERQGIDNPRQYNFHEAGALIGRIKKRWDANQCSVKMAKLLAKYGIDASEMGFDDAKAEIDAIAANGWKRP